MLKRKRPRVAVIPIGGFGTRFFPQTKAFPKEMLPLIDKPIIQHVVEDLVDSGIRNIIFATRAHKGIVETHFDYPSADVKEALQGFTDKDKILRELKKVATMAHFSYVRDSSPRGTAAPLMSVQGLITDDVFLYKTADDMIESKPSELTQLINAYLDYGLSCFAWLPALKDEDYDNYAFIEGKEIEGGIVEISNIVSRPGKKNSPSNMAVISSQVLTKDILQVARNVSHQVKDGEFSFGKVLAAYFKSGKKALGVKIKRGKFIDTGNKLEYLKAVVEKGVKDSEIGKEFHSWLKKLP